MTDAKRCAECGAELAADSPQGLCPGCLLKRGLETGTAASQGAEAGGGECTPPTPADLAAYFPDLEILELVGRGGMGVVYKARQKHLDRLVALKILSPEIGRDPAFAERFAREARAMAMLSHPHVVAVYDFGQADGLYYFLMEYVDGVNLRRLLDTSKLSPEEALAIVPQICDALQYAHDHGVVHRDIKPENVLLDKEGRVKIADFGIAKLVGREVEVGQAVPDISTSQAQPDLRGRSEPLTAAGQIMGTPQYMAPEQLEHPQSVDHRADIYSLGVVFYQMLTGELPIGRFAPPSKKVEIDVRLDEVVLRALEKEPDRRYQQASEIKTRVETIATTPRIADNRKICAADPRSPSTGGPWQWADTLAMLGGMTFTSSRAHWFANASALGFLGFLACLAFIPLPGMRWCLGFSGFFGFFWLIGVAVIVEYAARHKARQRAGAAGGLPAGALGTAIDREKKTGIIAFLLCVSGFPLTLLLAAVAGTYWTVWTFLALIFCVVFIALVLGMFGWRSAAGKAAVVISSLCLLAAVTFLGIVVYYESEQIRGNSEGSAFAQALGLTVEQAADAVERLALGAKTLGPTLIYEPDPSTAPFPDAILKTWGVMRRRLGKGQEQLADATLSENARQIAVSVIGASDADRQRVERLVASPGTLEFRILADAQRNKAIVESALKQPSKSDVLDSSGKKVAWWVPVKAGEEGKISKDSGVVWRSVKQGAGEVRQVLVLADPYNLTGGYLSHVEPATDPPGKPCLNLTFFSIGGELLSKLTGSHLPDKATRSTYKLGIILDGDLWSWPNIFCTISEHCKLTGSFTQQETSDLARILNAGALPVQVRLVEVVPPDTQLERDASGEPANEMQNYKSVQHGVSVAAAERPLGNIQPLDLLEIRVVGTIVDQPIDGFYLVESDGQVALGPHYGRANVGGLTPTQAEEKIKEQLRKTLAQPEVQVTLARRLNKWHRAEYARVPYTISPSDVLSVRVVGTLLDQPIDSFFLVESTGTFPLGPAYGRVQVKGLTLEAAENAIKKQLERVLARPEVQVTLPTNIQGTLPGGVWREVELPVAPYKIEAGDLLFIDAAGTLPAQPIRGIYLVEPRGTVALGPSYGRAKVEGMTLEKAEQTIRKKLEEVAAQPAVSVTLAGWVGDDLTLLPGTRGTTAPPTTGRPSR